MTPSPDFRAALAAAAGRPDGLRGVELDASEAALKAIVAARLSGVATLAYLEGAPVAVVLPVPACRRLLCDAGLLVEAGVPTVEDVEG